LLAQITEDPPITSEVNKEPWQLRSTRNPCQGSLILQRMSYTIRSLTRLLKSHLENLFSRERLSTTMSNMASSNRKTLASIWSLRVKLILSKWL
jgi:hypothetical protein